MPTELSKFLFEKAFDFAFELRTITITDPWYHEEGGNIESATEGAQKHSMASVLSGIMNLKVREDGGASVRELGGRHIVQGKDSWISQGKKTLVLGKGICTDCAAVAAVKMLEVLEESAKTAKLEIVSSTTHAFLIVNRDGELRIPTKWGEEAFCVDIWYQNQFAASHADGAFWMTDTAHPVVDFIRKNAYRLRVDVEIC